MSDIEKRMTQVIMDQLEVQESEVRRAYTTGLTPRIISNL